MNEEARTIQATFLRKANAVFQTTYRTFRHEMASLHRDDNENVHQKARAEYANRMHASLQHEAASLLENCQPAVHHQLSSALLKTILFFRDEFLRKTDEI